MELVEINNNMNKYMQKMSGDVAELSENAQALMAATADISEEKVEEARKRLSSALEHIQELCRIGCRKGGEGGHAIDQELHHHSLRYLGVVAGIGALMGCAIARRCACKRHSCR